MQVTVRGQVAHAYTGGLPFNASQPAVVFVHGALNDHSVWSGLARWFAHHGHGVLAVDLPGHMRSAGPLLPSVEDAADWLMDLLDAVGVASAAVVGHSMGSLIALEAAARHPARVRALVMVATAYPMAVSPALLAAARTQPETGMAMINALSISSLASKPGHPGPGTWLHGASLQLMAQVQAHGPAGSNVFLHDFEVCNAYRHGLEAAAAVTCPSHLLLGSADQMTPPKVTQALAQALRARLHVVPSGHALMQEQPDLVLQALRQALA